MSVSRLAALFLLAVLITPAWRVAEAQPFIEWPVRINCTGSGQQCAPDYEIAVGAQKRLEISFVPSKTVDSLKLCSSMEVEVFVNGVSRGAFPVGKDSDRVVWNAGEALAESNSVRFQVTGIQGSNDCNKGQLYRWAGIVGIRTQPRNVWRCSNEGVPAGLVQTGSRTDSSCPSGRANRIIAPQANQWICTTSPHPDGFVVTGRRQDTACPSGRARRIAPASTQQVTTLCPGTPAPPPEPVIIGQTINFACDLSLPSVRIRYPRAAERICPGSQVPAGYIVSAEPVVAGCMSNLRGKAIKIPDWRIQETVCAASPIPLGWRVVRTMSTTACSGTGQNARLIEATPTASGSGEARAAKR